MASLNLDTLKKKAPESPENTIQDAVPTTTVEAPSGTPKISLMKLKEFTSPIQEEVIHTSPQINEAVNETINVVEEMEVISLETPATETSTSLTIEDNEAAEVSSGESIFSSETLEKQESEVITPQEPETKIEEAKEFFPSLNLMEDFNISDDLLGIEDVSLKPETTTPIGSESETINIGDVCKIPQVIMKDEQEQKMETIEQQEVSMSIIESTESLVTEAEEIVAVMPIEEAKEESSSLSMPTTHVQEVKNELSEQRKGGFRFFANKKASVLAGIGIVTTFSLIGLFSAGFFSSAVPAGKSNIQEAVQPIVSEEVSQPTPEETIPEATPVQEEEVQVTPEVTPETIATTPEVTPEIVQPTPEIVEPTPTTSVYEAGRDYTVIKNTKKNLKKQ